MVVRPPGLRLRLSSRDDGSHQGPGDCGAGRRRDRGPVEPVCRHDEIPRRLVPGRRADRPRHAVRDGLGRPRQGTVGALGAGHRRTLLRHRALRHVEQRLHVDRQAQHRHRSGELPRRRAPLAGHAPGRRPGGVPLADALRVGQRADAGQRPAGLRRGERAAEAVQADARSAPGASRMRHRPRVPVAPGVDTKTPPAGAGAEDGRRRVLRAARPADEGQPPGARRRPDGREAEGRWASSRGRTSTSPGSIRTPPRGCSARWARSRSCRRA